MPWGSELPTRVRSHRTAWFDELTTLDRPPHREVWTGTMQANASAASAVAVVKPPSAVSSAVAHIPSSGDSFPHEFPWQFGDPKGSAAARAQVLTPNVGVGPNVAEAPLVTAVAGAAVPGVTSGATVHMPDGAGGQFPWQFPHQFADPTASVTASATAVAPVVTVDALVTAVLITASAGVIAPDVLSGVAASIAVITAAANALAPSVTSDTALTVPVATASADATTPQATSGASVAGLVAGASADVTAPDVSVTTVDFTVEVPVVTASAVVADAELVAVVEVPVATASAESTGFPYEFPYSFTPNGAIAPTVFVDASVSVPVVGAAGAVSAPTATSGVTGTPPVAAASGAGTAPSGTTDAAAAVPAAAASATAETPAVDFTMPPVVTPYTATGAYSYDVAGLRSLGYTHIDRIVLGAGGGGGGSTFLANAKGGSAGTFAWDTIALADYPSLTTITGTVATGGTAGPSGGAGGTGGNSTATGAGIPSLTGSGGAGGSGTGTTSGAAVSSGNANSGKDVSLNDQTYAGGATASAGSNGNTPGGGGGAASSSFSAGRVGGNGQVWFCARRAT